jgi:hypothetical protein
MVCATRSLVKLLMGYSYVLLSDLATRDFWGSRPDTQASAWKTTRVNSTHRQAKTLFGMDEQKKRSIFMKTE